jgi:hypothetical protein
MSCVAMSGTAVATVAAAGRKAIRGGAKVAGGSKVATQARRRVGVCGGAMEVRAEALGDPPVPIAVYAQGVGMMDMFEGLERQRILFIGDRIDENVCNKVCAQVGPDKTQCFSPRVGTWVIPTRYAMSTQSGTGPEDYNEVNVRGYGASKQSDGGPELQEDEVIVHGNA